jgi:hypothetical protein
MNRLLNSIENIFDITSKENKGFLFDGTIEELEKLSLLNEAIPISMYREWHKKIKELKGHGGTTYKDRFNSWFPEKKDGLSTKWRIYIPYGGKVETGRKLTTPKDIEAALKANGWEVKDYTTGQAVKKAGAEKDIKAEAWSSDKQYDAREFTSYNNKTYKSIKKPTLGVKPNEDKAWLDMEKVSGGAPKEEKKSIGSIFTALVASAKKSGDAEKEKLYAGLERKNQTILDRISSTKGTGGTTSDKYVVISRHPYDVMGSSTDRGWASCQNVGVGQEDYSTTQLRGKVSNWNKDKEYKSGEMVIFDDKIYKAISSSKDVKPSKDKKTWIVDDSFKLTPKKNKLTGEITKVATRDFPKEDGKCVGSRPGAYYHGIGADVRFGAMVAYVVSADDLDINNPVARMLIKPYVKMEGKDRGHVYLFPSPSQYGSQGGGRLNDDKVFRKTVDDWLEEHQTGEGAYEIKQKSISSSEPLKGQSWEHHYPEEPSKMTPKDYKSNLSNITKFKDGLTKEDIIDQHRWFLKNTFTNATVGEDYGTLIMYDGKVTGGTWEDKAQALGGTLNGIYINSGTFKDVKLSSSEVTTGNFKDSTLDDVKWKIRGKIETSVVSQMKISGSIIAKDTKFNDTEFLNIPEDSKLSFESCYFEDSKNLVGTFTKCTFIGNVTFSEKVNIKDGTFEDIDLKGGKFSGTLKSGKLKNVEISKIRMLGGTLVSCDVKNGIIQNGTLKNCDFRDGIFGYTPALGKKTKIEPEENKARKSSRNQSNFIGGNFYGGVFAGGHFTDGTWHDKAVWKGGTWHSGENKPKNAKERTGKSELRKLKGLDLKSRETSRKEEE